MLTGAGMSTWIKIKPTVFNLCAGIIILSGIVLRLRQFIFNRSFWLDEAALALNIVGRSPMELLQPLANNQGAPIGFLFISKIAIQILGNRDFVLRLFPFVAGCLALFFMFLLCKQILTPPASLLALSLFALNNRLIYYASEFKQYSSDVLISLALLVGYGILKDRPGPGKYVWLSLIGVFALWFSHPAVFILMGIGITMAIVAIVNKDWLQLRSTVLIILAWLISFGLLYLLSLQHLTANSALTDYWEDSFMTLTLAGMGSWMKGSFSYWFTSFVGAPSFIVGAFIFGFGFGSLLAHQWTWGLALLLPILTTLVASMLYLYPFGDRLILFLVPLALLAIAEGVDRVGWFFRRSRWIQGIVWLVLVGWLVFSPVRWSAFYLAHPRTYEEIKPVLQFVKAHRQPDDLLLVYYGAELPFRYYAPQFRLDSAEVYFGMSSRNAPEKYLQDLQLLKGNHRVWVLFSHNYVTDRVNEQAFFLEYLEQIGSRQKGFKAPGAAIFLYDLTDDQ